MMRVAIAASAVLFYGAVAHARVLCEAPSHVIKTREHCRKCDLTPENTAS
jgi:hypothetical protein